MQPPIQQQPYYPPPPPQQRGGPPVWVWGLVGCGSLFLCIPILGAILFPVFAQARSSARRAACMSNEKRQALGMLMYAQDYDGLLPRTNEWMDATFPYVKDEAVLHCPEVSHAATGLFGYAYNSKLRGVNLNKTKNANQLPMIYDSTNLSRNASDPESSLPEPGRHRGRNNVAFADGHAKAVAPGGVAPPE